MEQKKKTYVKIGKLFKNERNGEISYGGVMGNARVNLFKSKFPSRDGGEVWNLMVSEAEEKHQPVTATPQEFDTF